MISGYFVWWYSSGLTQAYSVAITLIGFVADNFSFTTLFRTLFAPWKDDVMTARNASLSDQLKIWEMNIASRIIGFLVRLVVIIVASVVLVLLLALAVLLLTLWVVTPALVLFLPLLGVGRLFV